MKRLFGLIGLTYLSVLAVVFYLSDVATVVLAFTLLVLLTAFVSFKKFRSKAYLSVIALTALVACVVNIGYTELVYNKTVDAYDGVCGEIVATLKEEPYKQYSTYVYRFNCESHNGEKCDFDFMVYHHDMFDIEPFDKAKLNATFMKSDSKGNISKGYFLTADFGYEYPDFERIVPERKPIYYHAIKLRQSIRETLRNSLSPDAFSLCSALLVGDKFVLSEDVYRQFREAGVSHLIVVSGMHFSALTWFFLFLARKYSGFRHIFLVFAVAFIVVYMAVTGFSPSVLRSAIMMLLCIIGFSIMRDTYPLNSLSFAALCVVLFDPYIAGDVGLILSFATTFSIIKLAPVIYDEFYIRIKILNKKLPKKRSFKNFCTKWLRRGVRFVLSLFCVNLSAYLISFPLSIILFGSTSTVSVFSTFALSFPIQVLLYLAVIICVVGAVPFLSFIVSVFAFCAQLLSDFVLKTVSFFADLPFSYMYVTSDFMYLWIVFAVILFVWLCSSFSKRRLGVYALVLAFTLTVGCVSSVLVSRDVSSLHIYDVDDGTAILYESGETQAVLSFDCSNANMRDALDEMQHDVSDVDFSVSVGNSANCAKNITSLSKVFAIKDVLLYDTKRTITLSDNTENVIKPDGDYVYTLPDGEKVTLCFVEEKYITYFEYNGKSLLILPDDVDVLTVPARYRKAHTIVLGSCPENYSYLQCDTLVLSTDESTAFYLMKQMYNVSHRVLLTSQGKITLIEEV